MLLFCWFSEAVEKLSSLYGELGKQEEAFGHPVFLENLLIQVFPIFLSRGEKKPGVEAY